MAQAKLDQKATPKNALHDLGYKIFLDRYAQKDMTRKTLAVGDTVIVVVDSKTGQREIGTVKALALPKVTIQLLDGDTVERDLEHVDKPLETDPGQMMDRVAAGIAAVEKNAKLRKQWTERFRWLLDEFKFVPAGRILTAAGTTQLLTFYNCYVLPSPRDSRTGIIETLRQMTEIMSRGGGVGINISSLRPRHAYVKGVNGRSSGAISWGALYSFVTGLIEQGGSRRGALMLILDDWHPDVFDFINSKRTAGQITNANISVGISDKLMEAIKADADWALKFPDTSYPGYDAEWDGDLDKWEAAGRPVITARTVKARAVWNAIIESAWASAEPGVFFKERYNKMSNSWYYAPIISTNPCGEQGLPAFGVCNLGAINLAKFYDADQDDVNWSELDTAVRYATRFLDNVIDATPYFFDENATQQLGERRVGLNNMGLAELLIRLRLRYGSDESLALIDKLYAFIARAAYETSAELAKEKGAFPQFVAEPFLQSGFMQSMPEDLREKVMKNGVRNVTLLTQAPNGTTGTMVNTSTGIEPFFSWVYYRKSRLGLHEERVPLVQAWFDAHPGETTLPDYFVTAMELAPEDHARVQGAIQRWCDSSISKCVTGDTLVLTARGLTPIRDLSSMRDRDQFEPLTVDVITPVGREQTAAFYYGGGRKTRRISMSYGYEIEGTPNHRIQVLGDDGCIRFTSLDSLHIGDTVILYMGQQVFGEPGGALPAYEAQVATDDSPVTPPAAMSPELAYVLGCIISAGTFDRNGIAINHESKARLACIGELCKRLFGMEDQCYIYPSRRWQDMLGLHINSLNLRNWLMKEIGIPIVGARRTIPSCILNAGRAEVAAFLRGFFLNARLTKDDQTLGISLEMPKVLKQLQVLLLNIGVLSHLHHIESGSWAIRVADASLEVLTAFAGLDQAWKKERMALDYDLPRVSRRNHVALLPRPFTKELRRLQIYSERTLISLFGTKTPDYRRAHRALHKTCRIERRRAYALYRHFNDVVATDYALNFFDTDKKGYVYLEVKRIKRGFAKVFDLNVPGSHSFIANGIGNHNTSNLPNSYTIEQTGKFYELLYDLGCKGGTVYRDGSRDEQVLMLKGDERAESEMQKKDAAKPEAAPVALEQVATPHRVYPRPKKLTGVTVNVQTPYGTAYITMNSDENGYPFEVFITAPGKAGSDLQADAEGLGRMISLQLRATAPQNRMQMLKLIIDQLQGIGGARSIGMGPNRVSSLPDAVAGTLLEHYFPDDKMEQLALFNVAFPELGAINSDPAAHAPALPAPTNGSSTEKLAGYKTGADVCPSCGTISLIRVEGCRKCTTCGYSEC